MFPPHPIHTIYSTLFGSVIHVSFNRIVKRILHLIHKVGGLLFQIGLVHCSVSIERHVAREKAHRSLCDHRNCYLSRGFFRLDELLQNVLRSG